MRGVGGMSTSVRRTFSITSAAVGDRNKSIYCLKDGGVWNIKIFSLISFAFDHQPGIIGINAQPDGDAVAVLTFGTFLSICESLLRAYHKRN